MALEVQGVHSEQLFQAPGKRLELFPGAEGAVQE